MISIFGSHKKHLAGKQFTMQQAITSWLQTRDIHLCCAATQALVPWCDECLNENDDFVVV